MHLFSGLSLRKVISGTFLAAALLTLCAPTSSARLRVVTTFTVIQDIAQNIAGGHANIKCLIPPGAEVHEYQPTPQDLLKAESAQLILWNGLHLEQWFKRFYGDLKDIPAVVVTTGIEPIPITHGPYKGLPNPHAWMSSENALIYIENIKNALVAHDPANAAAYELNARRYAEKIKSLNHSFKTIFDALPPERKWLVSSEGAFSYLARDYGLKELYLWPVNAEIEGTPQQLRKVIDTVRRKRIPVVFSESTISNRPALQIARETGARYGGVLYVDSLSEPDGPTPTYLDLLRTTVNTVAQGLKQ